jgi:hypothetical protein
MLSITGGVPTVRSSNTGERRYPKWGAYLGENHLGFTGPDFVTGFNTAGASDQFEIVGVPGDGDYSVQVRYDNDSGSGQQGTTSTLVLSVNGTNDTQLTLPPTSSPKIWSTSSVTVSLKKGTKSLGLIGCPVHPVP